MPKSIGPNVTSPTLPDVSVETKTQIKREGIDLKSAKSPSVIGPQDDYYTPTTETAKLDLPQSQERSSEELKRAGGDIKSGVDQTASGLQDAYQAGKEAGQPEAQQAKGKGKEAASKGKEALQAIAEATGLATDSLAKAAEAAESKAGELGGGTKKTGHGIANIAKVGADRAQTYTARVGSAMSAPVNWTYHKTTGLFTNARIAQPNERLSPWWGVAAIAAGTAGFALATAASWGATLFVTLPALAAGTATLGTLFLAQKLIRRMWNGAPTVAAGAENANMTVIGRKVHNACVAANKNLESGEHDLHALRAQEEKEILKCHKALQTAAAELAEHQTNLRQADAGLAILQERKVAPETTLVRGEAEVLDITKLNVAKEAQIQIVRSGEVEGKESSVAPAVHESEVAHAQMAASTSTAEPEFRTAGATI